MNASYITLQKQSKCRFLEKKSVFIGYAKPVHEEKQALDFLEEIRSLNKSATHNCYAYTVTENDNVISRYSDDGEPQGTAGLPILEVLRKQSIQNAIIVVTRYFGGILLGAPGLVRAYGKAASLAVQDAEICKMSLCVPVSITVDYHFYGKVQNALFDKQGQSPVFSDKVEVTYIIPETEIDTICKKVNDITNGLNIISLGDKDYYYVQV